MSEPAAAVDAHAAAVATEPSRNGERSGRRRVFERDEWAQLRAATPLPLDPEEVEQLRGLNEHLSLDEVQDVYLPLSRLLNLRVGATAVLRNVTDAFLGVIRTRPPFVIGLAGSVAVGKSTTARVLRELLARWPDHPRVELVTTDGFLYPNAVLAARGLTPRKGFPESYDTGRLVGFLDRLKKGEERLEIPVYDHSTYDIVPGRIQRLWRPDVVIVEGLNVLQGSGPRSYGPRVSDYFDWSIYVDADPDDIERWYVDRFHALRRSAADDPDAFFHRFSALPDDEATEMARGVWRTVNLPNLRDNIEPTRERADLVLEKAADHRVRRVGLRLY